MILRVNEKQPKKGGINLSYTITIVTQFKRFMPWPSMLDNASQTNLGE